MKNLLTISLEVLSLETPSWQVCFWPLTRAQSLVPGLDLLMHVKTGQWESVEHFGGLCRDINLSHGDEGLPEAVNSLSVLSVSLCPKKSRNGAIILREVLLWPLL